MDKELKKLYKVKKLEEGLFSVSSSAVLSYILLGKEKALVLDTAYGFGDLHAVVREITGLPLIVVNSHGHIDHTGGNFYFPEHVYLHEADWDLYKKHNSPDFHRELEKTLRVVQRIAFWKTILPKHPEENDKKRVSFSNFLPIREGDSFDLGGLHAEVVEIPGHTLGSTALFIPEKKLILASDGANAGIWLFLPESQNLSVYRNSLYKLRSLTAERILTGHSEKFFGMKDLDSWIRAVEDPDLKGGKPQKQDYLAPGADVRRVYAKGHSTMKDPFIVLDLAKAD